jgi:ATP-dependent DNA helicase RecQ
MNDARRILSEVFGYPDFRPLQEAVIQQICAGKDALLVMPTGSGKSLCFQIPALMRPGLAVVVSPLIALMHDQVNALVARGVAAACLNSSQTAAERQEVSRQLLAGELDLLYVAPERLLMPGFLQVLDQLPLALFAIDEAHCVSAWGHDFRPEYLQLSILGERYPGLPRLALTATADPATREDIITQLELSNGKVFIGGFDRPNIYYRVQPKTKSHLADLLHFIQQNHAGHSGIVYRLTRADAEATAAWLTARGVSALPYHAGLDDATRKAHQDRFLNEPGIVIVATIAFGMGVNKPEVRFVAHLDMPKSLEDYHQQTGRAGRDGLPADAWMLFGAGDLIKLKHFIRSSEADAKFKRLEYRRLQEMESFCTTHQCRRHLLLKHFGETPSVQCGHCDVCGAKHPAPARSAVPPLTAPAPVAASRPAIPLARLLQALAAVLETESMGRLPKVAAQLAARSDTLSKSADQAQVSDEGAEQSLTAEQWEAVLESMVLDHYLVVRGPQRDQLAPGPRAGELLRQALTTSAATSPAEDPGEVMPADPPRRAPRNKRRTEESEEAWDEGLYEKLAAKRLELAREASIPAFCICSNETLRELSRRKPLSTSALLTVHGIGPVKLEQYGKQFLQVICDHCLH